MFPAFKEWQVIVDALAAGDQSLLLRKGGIAEGRGGFDPGQAERFWLFPTQFHAQREKTKPATALRFCESPVVTSETAVTLTAFAEVVHRTFIADWDRLAALDSLHGWTEAAVREKFEWSQPPGLHALVVRVHRLNEPISLPRTAAMGGCKSWIELPLNFADQPSTEVVPATEIARVVAAVTG